MTTDQQLILEEYDRVILNEAIPLIIARAAPYVPRVLKALGLMGLGAAGGAAAGAAATGAASYTAGAAAATSTGVLNSIAAALAAGASFVVTVGVVGAAAFGTAALLKYLKDDHEKDSVDSKIKDIDMNPDQSIEEFGE